MKAQLQRIFTHIPEIKTERLILRRISVFDAEDMYEYSSDAEVTKYLLWDTHPSLHYTSQYTEYLQKRYAVGDFYDWAVTLRGSGKMIGTCGFSRFLPEYKTGEVGYVLNRSFWGRGYASEALSAVITFGFEHIGLHRIMAVCMAENGASLAVMKKCGLRLEGVGRQSVWAKGKCHDAIVCARLATDMLP